MSSSIKPDIEPSIPYDTSDTASEITLVSTQSSITDIVKAKLQPPEEENGDYVMIRTKSFDKSCYEPCPCQCHIPVQGTSPRWLRGMIGSLFLNFTGTPLVNHRSCNAPKCGTRHRGRGSIHFQYFFPRWLLPMGVEITGTWRDVMSTAATWSIQVPRVVTDLKICDELFSLVESRSVLELQQYLVENKIALIDLSADGSTIFEVYTTSS